ncbi:hypothetical protein QZM18_04360 [Burkholderia diffusa]|uniref:hypothetical protein n=1 Tax=Burkholderia diffusa TaxID=488732 RepID=UPI00264F1A44|nr:hypothetical protein [Burkholderia diffusa]MDN7903358.1 hypothetical protein [Burkholderia diffusa]
MNHPWGSLNRSNIRTKELGTGKYRVRRNRQATSFAVWEIEDTGGCGIPEQVRIHLSGFSMGLIEKDRLFTGVLRDYPASAITHLHCPHESAPQLVGSLYLGAPMSQDRHAAAREQIQFTYAYARS